MWDEREALAASGDEGGFLEEEGLEKLWISKERSQLEDERRAGGEGRVLDEAGLC